MNSEANNFERFSDIKEPGNASVVECMSNDEQAVYEIVTSTMRPSSNTNTGYSCHGKVNFQTFRTLLELQRKGELSDNYKEIVKQYLEKGYIRKISEDDKQ